METYEKWNIQETPLSAPFFRKRVQNFLERNGLRMEALDAYYSILDEDGEILSGAGISGTVIKCVAVSAAARSEGLLVPLISHIVSLHPGVSLRVFTKAEYEAVFGSLGFRLLARSPQALLLENGRGAERYAASLSALRVPGARSGVAVMNANPFTLGHRYLLEQAARQVDALYVIPVKEDVSDFPYQERLEMIRSVSGAVTGARTIVADGSDYQISALTFPTYFLKDLSDASETQMRLDLDLFGRLIAPALGVSRRFVGSEPMDPLTARYNALMREILPAYGVEVVEIPRLATPGAAGTALSATEVRAQLADGHYAAAAALVPEPVRPYLLGHLACRALQKELDTPLKPGLVGPDSNGAHKDMDYALMQKGIAAIRPYFARMAQAESAGELRQLGIEAEEAMMQATGGVNTHRGAIFCLGLAVYAASRKMETADNQKDMQNALREIGQGILSDSLNVNNLHFTLVGARRMAWTAYRQVFEDWLPYYRSLKGASRELQLLLRIMSTLDDTCVVKRVGFERAQEVKAEAKALLETAGQPGPLCERYAAEGISPGGAADMLAMTIFIDSIL